MHFNIDIKHEPPLLCETFPFSNTLKQTVLEWYGSLYTYRKSNQTSSSKKWHGTIFDNDFEPW